MTTHFTSGVTNVATGGTGEKLKLPDPIKYHVYHEDFDKYTASDWVITTTEGGGGDATEALGDGDGGLLVVTNDAADNDSDEFQWAGGSGGVIESFKYEAAKGLYFKTRFKVSDATQSDFVMGLHITDTSPLDVTDGIFFISADGAATLDFQVEKDNTATTTSSVATMANDTFITTSWFIDPDRDALYYSINNGTPLKSVATNLPNDEDLTISFGIQNGEAVAKTMTIDYITMMVER